MLPLEIFVSKPVANGQLANIRQQIGNTIARMCDVYTVGLANADYVLTIKQGMLLSEFPMERILRLLASCNLVDENGEKLVTGKSISVRHERLGKHFFIFIDHHGQRVIYYNVSDWRDKDNLVLSLAVEDVRTGDIREVTQLKAERSEDVRALAIGMNLAA